MQFRTRTRGTARQIGQTFPIFKKKKLPAKIALKQICKRPTLSNMESGVTDITYTPPTEDQDGFLEFKWCGHKISGAIRLVDREDSIAQWSTEGRPVAFVDKKLGAGWIKYCVLHELLERFLQNHYNIPWQRGGHTISEEVERREMLKGHSPQEYAQYDKQVAQISRMNAGAKVGKKVDLERAFELLAQKRRQLAWQDRGISGILHKQTDRRELAGFQKQLKNSIDKRLAEE